MYLFMFSIKFLPYNTAFAILIKLSESKIASEEDLATSVPSMPETKPMSAFFKAGASLVPVPNTATTLPAF